MKISDRIRMARFARFWPPAGAQKCPTLGGEVGRVKALSTDYSWTTDSSPQRHLEAFIVSTEGKILCMWTTGKARKWVHGVGGGLILVRVGGGGGGVNPYKGWKGGRSLRTSFIPRQLT
jgi:hypothetical protein